MIQAIENSDWGFPAYIETVDGGAWSLTGTAGSLREWQWDFYRDGLVLDLVQVYAAYKPNRHSTMRYPLWAAGGLRGGCLPPPPKTKPGTKPAKEHQPGGDYQESCTG